MLDKLILSSLCSPGSIAPPLITIPGIFILKSPIIIPGTILSQFGIKTTPSSPCAITILSTESAISSLEGREYFIPKCPIAIPSQTPIEGIRIGVPPPIITPVFTA